MDDVKKVYREGEQQAKETWRRSDGDDLKDQLGNAGDEVRKDLGNAGDDLRKTGDDMERKLDDRPSGTSEDETEPVRPR